MFECHPQASILLAGASSEVLSCISCSNLTSEFPCTIHQLDHQHSLVCHAAAARRCRFHSTSATQRRHARRDRRRRSNSLPSIPSLDTEILTSPERLSRQSRLFSTLIPFYTVHQTCNAYIPHFDVNHGCRNHLYGCGSDIRHLHTPSDDAV